jgi:hypothetical protein
VKLSVFGRIEGRRERTGLETSKRSARVERREGLRGEWRREEWGRGVGEKRGEETRCCSRTGEIEAQQYKRPRHLHLHVSDKTYKTNIAGGRQAPFAGFRTPAQVLPLSRGSGNTHTTTQLPKSELYMIPIRAL